MATINDQARLALQRELAFQAVTQRDLAKALGVSEKHISHVLCGRSIASLHLLDAAAHQLGCSWHIGITPDDDLAIASEVSKYAAADPTARHL